jgi:hypothetical protein
MAALVEELATAPVFELYRLRAAIDQLVQDPARVAKVKACLRPGMTISWFDECKNRLFDAKILELQRTRVLVQNVEDGARWQVSYASLNLEGVPVHLPASGEMGRLAWKVGDSVAFRDKQNRDLYGTIVSLNPKTATVVLKDNHKWRVAYQLLIPVWDAEARSADGGSAGALPPRTERTLRVIQACDPREERAGGLEG